MKKSLITLNTLLMILQLFKMHLSVIMQKDQTINSFLKRWTSVSD